MTDKERFKNEVLKTIQGYRTAAHVIRKERIQDLENLSFQEAFARFTDICNFHDMMPQADSDALEKKKIRDICTLRERLNRIGEKSE